MRRFLLLSLLALAGSLVLSGCGIVNHQLHRAVNLLRVPVRVSEAAPAPPVDLSRPVAARA